MDKTILRKKFKEERKIIDKKHSLIIQKNVEQLNEFKIANSCFCYLSFGSEAETKNLIDKMLEMKKNVLVPLCNPKERTMKAVQIFSMENLKEGNYGILEPCDGYEYEGNIDIAIVPSLAFDVNGVRLGYGAGYYDKFLKGKNILKIGINYDCLVVEKLPSEPHDIKMDIVVTEERIVKVI